MALPSKYGIEKNINSMEGLDAYKNGGKGSGNFGHSGRPGEVGGSAPSGSGTSGSTKKYTKDGSAKDKMKKSETKKPKNTEAMPNKKSQESATAWAKKNFTSGGPITDKDMSFDEVLARMVDGEDYYKIMGSDSVDREALFTEMAKRTGLDYGDIYSVWMGYHSGRARGYTGELTRSPRYRELRQKDNAGLDAWQATGSRDKFLNPKELDEKGLRDMVSSVWTYSGGKDDRYLHDGYKSLTDKERKKIIDDEWKYLDDNCTRTYAGEDSEGGSYRGIKYRPSEKKSKNSLENVLTDTIDKLINGGKGSGNFDHAGRPGEVGGSAPSGSGGSTSSSEKKKKALYDDGNLGTAPLIAVEDNGKYKAKSFASEADTRKLLEADGDLKKVADLAYDKSIKGEKPTEAQQMVFQQITGIRQLLAQKVGEMGDAMTFVDKKMDWDNYDAVMAHTAEFLTKARLAAMDDKSKIGGKLNEAISTLSNIRDRIVDLGDPDKLNRGGEPSWYDIDDMVKRRKL